MRVNRVEVVVDAADGVEVAPDLWGIFLEDLNYALDGGLNAELLRNGDFEFTGQDGPLWGPLTGWGIETASSLRTVWARTEDPLSQNNSTYLRVHGETILRNEGWDGISVQRGKHYRLRFAARLAEERTTATVSARISQRDAVLAAAGSAVIDSAAWQWHELAFQTSAAGAGQLELTIPAGAVIDLDGVSLRPIGDDGQPELFRADLLAALAELRPSFVRFPGGCLAHGVGLDNIYDWKGSIGPLHERRQLTNPWGYHQSRAIGYYEFFLLCERLDASPLPVIAAGVCCQNTPGGPRAVPLGEMAAFIQDALDLIEFANGDLDTTWGARRAELGHPEPFHLRYFGLGNEDEISADFRDRYARIEDAVRAAHPDIEVIGTSGPSWFGRDYELGWEFARERRTALVDEHYYEAPLWFHQNLDRYDGFDRSGPGVYLGEYAARSNRVRSALAEAAYMIGLERNSDVVRLASYAPLLARVGNTQWQPDLIYFDADTVMTTASFHVQKMFSTERGDTVHAVRTDVDSAVPVRPVSHGPVTFRLGEGSFALTDMRLGESSIGDRRLDGGLLLEIADQSLDEFELSFVAERLTGSKGFAIDLGADGPDPALTLELGSWRNEHTTVKRRQFAIPGDVAEGLTWRGFATRASTIVKVVLSHGRLRVWIDGMLLHDIQPSTAPEQRFAAGAISRTGAAGREHVVRLVNATDGHVPVSVKLEGRQPTSARSSTLEGAEPDQGQPFEASPVVPVDGVAAVAGDAVELDLAPWSFTVAVIESQASGER